MSYPHSEIDRKWQEIWDKKQTFKADNASDKPKFYALDMFPYPSGSGLHIGHLASYTPTDILARYKRNKGFNVLHPMGYDAFGLPAEQYAIQTGVHPAETTRQAIENFRRQLKMVGISFDWSREISTCDPSYYKWTQFIFLKLFERGLAYQTEVPVNWCPALQTVLANDEVIDGKSERGGHPVFRVPMRQWMLKITDYAEKLLEGLDRIDWPERTKEGQRNWIGKSEGALVTFQLAGSQHKLEIFTTRPDTLFGVTFMVIAPEHPLVEQITAPAQKQAVDEYVRLTAARSELDRKAGTEKTGVFTGGFALHPLSGQTIPIWVADYVLMDYGTGAIMAVPGHDTRDFEFAQKFQLPVERVIASEEPLPFTGNGVCVNSQFLNGLSKSQAIPAMIEHLEKSGSGKREVQYKLRDWLFSRQRFWGEPFPLVHYDNGEVKPVPLNELPVLLPAVADYQPTEKGEPPLARAKEWVHYTDPQTQEAGRRETDTMPGAAGSSWYFLRFTDPHNDAAPFDFEAQRYWMPVDLYIGGPEHTVGHLLYSRFWHKVLFDAGLVTTDEPFTKLAHQGMLLGANGEKMSKSRGNTVNPDELAERYGADTIRVFINFLGPLDRDKPWDHHGIEGARRFLERVWRLCVDPEGNNLATTDEAVPEQLLRLLHKSIKKVSEDIESLNFNTAISTLMILTNEVYKHKTNSKLVLLPLVQLLSPIAPHVCEELWERLEGKGLVSLAPWPAYDPALTVDDVVTIGVQVNGKNRGSITLAVDADEATAVQLAREVTAVQNALHGGQIVKTIYKAGRILNIISK